jgi:reductive dehalogenase
MPETIDHKIERYDERNNVQARHELAPGSSEWENFYRVHPELKEGDLKQHDLPGVMGVGSPVDNKAFLSMVTLLGQLGHENMVDGPVDPDKIHMTPERATEKIKGFGKHLGASLIRIGPLNQSYVYSHKGRRYHRPGNDEPEPGTPVILPHKNAIVIAEGLNYKIIRGAPQKQVNLEVFRAYSKLGQLAVVLARYIRSLGYPARAHMVTNYQIVVPPVAIDAGIGQLGRHGVIISKEFGSAMKMSVVTTDLPLIYDQTMDLGVEDFCRHCKICAETCPSGAISHGDKKIIRGIERYPFKAEACFMIWNETGTDCGVCVASCPFSKPPSLFHSIGLRIAATGGRLPAMILTTLEKALYGSHDPSKYPAPEWMEEPPSLWKKYRFGRKRS